MSIMGKRFTLNKVKWLWSMLILVTAGLLMSGCGKATEEEPLDASRPIYTGDGSDELPQTNNLSGSTWQGVTNEYALRIKFDESDCLFTGYDYVAKKDTTASYAYSFSWPLLTLTPKDDKGGVITGKASNGYNRYTMTFVDSTDSGVWMQVEIRKTTTFR